VGVVVPLALLVAILLERSTFAAPPTLLAKLAMPPPNSLDGGALAFAGAVRQVSLRLALLSARPWLFVLMLAAGVAVGYITLPPLFFVHRLVPREQRQVFRALDSTWRGSLEYADDRTGQHFTYPTTMTIRSLGGGSGLRLTAVYTGSSAVDQTTFLEEGHLGRFSVTNGGPLSSHSLSGIGDLVRMQDGGFAFQGKNSSRDSDVRIRFTLRANLLTIQEEYRVAPQKDYHFRNRFTIHRSGPASS
jgi:hypothetical protein